MKDYKLPENKTPFDKFRHISRDMIKFFVHAEHDSLPPALYIRRRSNGGITIRTIFKEEDGLNSKYMNVSELL